MMTWEQKFAAINRLAPAQLVMSKPGRWRVEHSGVETVEGSKQRYVIGRGTSPQAAVEDHWERLTNLQPSQCILVDAYKNTRRTFIWRGHAWAECQLNGKL